jgi:hypothetical protein
MAIKGRIELFDTDLTNGRIRRYPVAGGQINEGSDSNYALAHFDRRYAGPVIPSAREEESAVLAECLIVGAGADDVSLQSR